MHRAQRARENAPAQSAAGARGSPAARPRPPCTLSTTLARPGPPLHAPDTLHRLPRDQHCAPTPGMARPKGVPSSMGRTVRRAIGVAIPVRGAEPVAASTLASRGPPAGPGGAGPPEAVRGAARCGFWGGVVKSRSARDASSRGIPCRQRRTWDTFERGAREVRGWNRSRSVECAARRWRSAQQDVCGGRSNTSVLRAVRSGSTHRPPPLDPDDHPCLPVWLT